MSSSKFSACGETGLVFMNKIIHIVEVALKCSKSPEGINNNSNDTEESLSNLFQGNKSEGLQQLDYIFAHKLLDLLNLIKGEVQIETLLKDDEVVDNFGSFSPAEFNSTSFQVELLDPVTSPTEAPRGVNKIQNLELIKVAVLIFVISIIMLTTCRMVFQLFIRFRPEKPRA